MKLKAVVDSLDDVDENLRELYTQFDAGGSTRFRLNVDGVTEHPDTLALKSAHERTKARNRELQTELDAAKDRLAEVPEDFDADLYQRAKDGELGPGDKPDVEERIRTAVEAAKKRVEDAANKDKQKLTEERDKFRAIAENQVKRAAIDEALDAINVVEPAYRVGARALLMPSLEVHEEDGKLVALAKDPDLGDTLPVAERAKAWAQTDEGKAYVSARESAGGGANGGGKGGSGTSDTSNNPWTSKGFNVTEQARIRRENPEEAQRLMREAGISAA